jgi:hypothetical protein
MNVLLQSIITELDIKDPVIIRKIATAALGVSFDSEYYDGAMDIAVMSDDNLSIAIQEIIGEEK